MKSLLFAITLLFSLTLFAQVESSPKKEEKAKRKAEKAERKAAKKALRDQERLASIQKSNELIESKYWVLEATRLQLKKGSVQNMNQNLNFVATNDDKGVIQLAFQGIQGWNGIGGITLEGKYSQYNITQPKKEGGGVSLQAIISGATFSGPVTMFLNVRSNDVEVRLTGSFGERITFYGVLKHPDESNVFKGTSTTIFR